MESLAMVVALFQIPTLRSRAPGPRNDQGMLYKLDKGLGRAHGIVSIDSHSIR